MSFRPFGWRRDLPDPRHHRFGVLAGIPLPDSVDLRDAAIPVYDQGHWHRRTADSSVHLASTVMSLESRESGG